MKRRTVLGAGAAMACTVSPLIERARAQASMPRSFVVEHYAVRIEPDLDARTLVGRQRIDIVAGPTGVATLAFDAGSLEIDAVRSGNDRVRFAKNGSALVIELPGPVAAGGRRQLHIAFRGAPTHGLEFHPGHRQFYTVFSTSQWMVCVDDPSVRATLDLTLIAPPGFSATGSGEPVTTDPGAEPDGRARFRWQQRTPVPSFTYGFAAGLWREAVDEVGGVKLRYLSAQRSPEELRTLFADTGDAIAFMGECAGISYANLDHGSRYEQALVVSTIGQEAAGFALLSEAYGERVLRDPAAQSLIAHEIAHQWWGVHVTCADWGHFWLNEGMATFMAAAWLERRFGAAAYLQQVKLWSDRVDRLRSDGADHALVYAKWNKPTANDRAVVYTKGAYVLHLLREELGDGVFWSAIRAYTRRFIGRGVTTADFEQAVQASAGRDLRPFFARWVHRRAATIGQ